MVLLDDDDVIYILGVRISNDFVLLCVRRFSKRDDDDDKKRERERVFFFFTE